MRGLLRLVCGFVHNRRWGFRDDRFGNGFAEHNFTVAQKRPMPRTDRFVTLSSASTTAYRLGVGDRSALLMRHAVIIDPLCMFTTDLLFLPAQSLLDRLSTD
jgi:hypothetical protein